MARTRVVLREEVPKLGDAGDVVMVAAGYARNFLIPRGLAVVASKGNVKQAEGWASSRAARVAKERERAEELRSQLEAQPFVVEAQAGPDGRLFGSVTSAQIAQLAAERIGADIDRHAIELAEPIRHLGMHEVSIPLGAEVVAQVTVEVVGSTQ